MYLKEKTDKLPQPPCVESISVHNVDPHLTTIITSTSNNTEEFYQPMGAVIVQNGHF